MKVITSKSVKSFVIQAVPLIIAAYIGSKLSFVYRTAEGNDFSSRLIASERRK